MTNEPQPDYSLRSLSGAFEITMPPEPVRPTTEQAISDLQKVGKLPANIQVTDSASSRNAAGQLTVRVSWELKPEATTDDAPFGSLYSFWTEP